MLSRNTAALVTPLRDPNIKQRCMSQMGSSRTVHSLFCIDQAVRAPELACFDLQLTNKES
jgi:hypothetical protein